MTDREFLDALENRFRTRKGHLVVHWDQKYKLSQEERQRLHSIIHWRFGSKFLGKTYTMRGIVLWQEIELARQALIERATAKLAGDKPDMKWTALELQRLEAQMKATVALELNKICAQVDATML
jgi:predicted oxidoreductase